MMQAIEPNCAEPVSDPREADGRMSPAVIMDELRRFAAPQRVEMLGKILDLYLEYNELSDTKLVGLFDAMVATLAEKLERRDLIALGQRLASLTNELPVTVRRLAREDEIAISGPLIERSDALTDDDLLEIAKKSEHHLVAVSRRKALSIAVTDALIGRAPLRTIEQIVANPDAQFSEVGFVNVIQKAKRDLTLAKSLAARLDIPTELRPFVDMLLGNSTPAAAAAN